MSLRTSVLGRAAQVAVLAFAASVASCAKDAAPVSIAPEPPPPVSDRAPEPLPAPAPHAQGVRADTFTFESQAIGFKMAVAVPEGGHLCIIVPETAQDPTACIGLDPTAMLEALPKGVDRPFGVAYARTGDWSYIVMLSPMPADVEAREDILEIVSGAEKAVLDASGLAPKVIADTPGERFDIFRVKDVPIVKFRIDAPHPPDKPEYELATTLYYAAYGRRAAMVTFLTSPKDIDKVMPYAEASIRTVELPPREAPERFGKPRAELGQQSTRTAIMIFGPLTALGILLFWWLGKSRKPEPPPAPAKKRAPAKPAPRDEDERDPDDDEEADSGEEASSSEEGDTDDEPGPDSEKDGETEPEKEILGGRPNARSKARREPGAASRPESKSGAPSEEDAPPSSEPESKK